MDAKGLNWMNSKATAAQSHPMAEGESGFALLNTIIPTIILCIYVFLRMIYIGEGGTVQVADIFIAIFMPFFVNMGGIKKIFETNRFSILLIVTFLIINLIWFFITGDETIGINLAYYTYNFLLFVFVFNVREGNRTAFDRYLPLTILVAAATQIIAIGLISGDIYRSVGTFSNPNQLAYWSICLVTMHMLIARERTGLTLAVTALLGACLMLSLSRGGLTGFAAVAGLYLLQRFRNIHFRVFAFLGASIFLLLFTGSDAFQSYRDDYQLASRLEERSEARSLSDELENRNYTRLTTNPEYILFGAGEGAFGRFEGERYKEGHYQGIEIHSNYATLLFSYGILGLLLFVAMLVRFGGMSMADTIYLSGILLYGMSHNGLRFSLFWVVIAVLVSVCRHKAKNVDAP
jgi:hypothetical protein